MHVLGDAGMGGLGGNIFESADGVSSGTLAGSTCIGDSGCILIYGCGATGWTGIGCTAGGVGAGAVERGMVAGAIEMDEKNWGGS